MCGMDDLLEVLAITEEAERYEARIGGVFTAVEHGDAARLRSLLQANPELADAIDESGYRPIHRAIERNDLECVRTLLQAGADPKATGPAGQRPLAWAVTHTAYASAQLLREHGASLDLWCAAGLGLLAEVAGFWNPDGSLKPEASSPGPAHYDMYGKLVPGPALPDAEVISNAFTIAHKNGHEAVAEWLRAQGAEVKPTK